MLEALPTFSHAGRCRGQRVVPVHDHDGCELVYVKCGRCDSVFQTGAGEVRLGAETGQLFVIPPRTPHNQIDLEMTETIDVVFQPIEEFDSTLRVTGPFHDELFEEWLAALQVLNNASKFRQCRALLYALLIRFCDLEQHQNQNERLPPQLRRALHFIDLHYTDAGLAIADIAVHTAVSIGYLQKLFRLYLGLSPQQYVQDKRMYLARQLLRNPYLFISEVGQKCGYRSPNYFSHIFRRHNQMTPEEFREYITPKLAPETAE